MCTVNIPKETLTSLLGLTDWKESCSPKLRAHAFSCTISLTRERWSGISLSASVLLFWERICMGVGYTHGSVCTGLKVLDKDHTALWISRSLWSEHCREERLSTFWFDLWNNQHNWIQCILDLCWIYGTSFFCGYLKRKEIESQVHANMACVRILFCKFCCKKVFWPDFLKTKRAIFFWKHSISTFKHPYKKLLLNL